MALQPHKTVLALDVGERRIGVASASLIAKLPSALTTIDRQDDVIQDIVKLISDQQAVAVVIGLPRGLSGQETKQTTLVRAFARDLQQATDIRIFLQDEALTSKQAETELKQRRVRYNKEAVDALAAVYILSDWLGENREFSGE